MALVMENVGRRSEDWSEPGTPTDVGSKSLNGYERNVLFWNRGELGFEDVAYATGSDRIEDGRGLAVADFDRNGQLDLAIQNNDRPAVLLMGRDAPHGWIQFELVGVDSPRDGVGARVSVETRISRQSAQVSAGSGFLSTRSKIVHFGLGSEPGVQLVTIRWPSGRVETYECLEKNRRYTMREGEGTPALPGPHAGRR